MNRSDPFDTVRKFVGVSHVLTDDGATARYRLGFRSGGGPAVAVVRPGSLTELWSVAKWCLENDFIVIMQAANTGLTEGSTPNGEYDRPVVIINTLRINKTHLVRGGEQVICHAGATLNALETALAAHGRAPHSVLGSSCIGASVVGGICNNSGGALIERGPAYTEMALFARLNRGGRLVLENNLGIHLGSDPETILKRLDAGDYDDSDIIHDSKWGSDHEYGGRVRDVTASSPSRFNADKRRLFEASGSAGKVVVFAVRVDTFPQHEAEKTFYLGTNDPSIFARLRIDILSRHRTLPVSAEYIHGDLFDLTALYGKDMVFAIDRLGTRNIPRLFEVRARCDAALSRLKMFGNHALDRSLQLVNRFSPRILPRRLLAFRKAFAHHLILTTHDDGIPEAEALLRRFKSRFGAMFDYFACSDREARLASLHRFAAAGAAVRYAAVHAGEVGGLISLDIALRRNEIEWLEILPDSLAAKISHRLYYGHFLCHVFHQDYIVKGGVDVEQVKRELLAIVQARGAEYPAEHNVGHLYNANEDLARFYMELDPTNSLNPGIGKLPRSKCYTN